MYDFNMGMGESDVSEKIIQKAVMELLLQHPKVAVVWQNDSNRTKGRKFGAGKFRPKGLPDICGVIRANGRFFAIELKKPGGKASPEQTLFLQKINDAGAFATLAFSVEAVKDWIEKL